MGALDVKERFKCALVCRAWAEAAAAAATRTVIKQGIQDASGLQRWLHKHGNHVEFLQLQSEDFTQCSWTALPCPHLQNLLLLGPSCWGQTLTITSRVCADISAATKLTSVSLKSVTATCHVSELVSALSALPHLKQLTFSLRDYELFNRYHAGSDSILVQNVSHVISPELRDVTIAALMQQLCSLHKLQHLSIDVPKDWAAANCAGLQQLTALTSLELTGDLEQMPDCISQLTALQQLSVTSATPMALNGLQVLSGLTQLRVENLEDLNPHPSPLQLPALQHLELRSADELYDLSMSLLARCTQLRVLALKDYDVRGPVSWAGGSSTLQCLKLAECDVHRAAEAGTAAVLHFFPPSALPQLTSLQWVAEGLNRLNVEELEAVAACCPALQAIEVDDAAPIHALIRLPHLTSLHLTSRSEDLEDRHCSSLAQMTGLRDLRLAYARDLTVAGLRHLSALQQLTCLGLGTLYIGDVLRAHLSDQVPKCKHGLVNKAPRGSPPDVAARLLLACDQEEAAAAAGHYRIVRRRAVRRQQR